MKTNSPDIQIVNELLTLLAVILSKGLTDQQRTEVLGKNDLTKYVGGAKRDWEIFGAFSLYYKERNDLTFVLDIYRRIQATQSFYRDIGVEMTKLSYFIEHHNLSKLVENREKITVFVMLPFTEENKATYEIAIKPALEEIGCTVEYADEANLVDPIIDTIFKKIAESTFLIGDTTGRNPNVFYEIGYAHALGKSVILLVQDSKEIPFNLSGFPHIVYSPKSRNALKEKLRTIATRLIGEIT